MNIGFDLSVKIALDDGEISLNTSVINVINIC